jgi:hypothetical protein
MKRYSFLWVTGLVFLVSLFGHWWFGWQTFLSEQAAHGQAPETVDYLNEMLRDTFENWQSEFLQLIWQVAALAFLYHAGSPASRGDDERMEAKLDALLRDIDGDRADRLIEALDRKYPGRHASDTEGRLA